MQLIVLRGGACHICGYRRHPGALTFHHLDPLTKEMNIAGNHTRAMDVLEHEVRKCALLCMNCHRELHDGAAVLPSAVVAEISAYIRDLPRARLYRPQGRPRSRADGL
jgi:hypothetical protein